MTIFRAVLCAALLWLASPLIADDIREVHVRTLPAAQLPAMNSTTHELRIAAYWFKNGKWTDADVVPALMQSAALLGQCGIKLAHANLRVIEAPRRFHFYATAVSRELLRRLQVAKPALFFVDDTLNRPAFDAEAIGRANSTTRPELVNTVWIAHGARDLPQALAHELVHVLSDSGEHSAETGNLMRVETSPANTQLTEAQCTRMRTQGVAHGLLQPVM
jgi:hypothetical protein